MQLHNNWLTLAPLQNFITVWNVQKMTIAPLQRESPLGHPPYLPRFSIYNNFYKELMVPHPHPTPQEFPQVYTTKKTQPLQKSSFEITK